MSISDLSLSSPRKGGKNRDKSFTYDEDFENFLNETSDSDLSTNRYKKKSNLTSEKPWWMKDDTDSPIKTSAPNKSFMKKPKLTELSPKKLGITLESDEFLQEHQNIKLASDLPALSLDKNSSVSESKNNNLRNNEYDEEKFDDEETSTALSSPHQSKSRNSARYSENANKASVNSFMSVKEEEQEKSLDTKSGRSLAKSASISNHQDQEATTINNKTNLLSKVIMDSMTSGELGRTGNTVNLAFANTSTGKLVHFNDPPASNGRMGGTQTRRDLADLEEAYQNFADFNNTDSGLNTMMKTVINQRSGNSMNDDGLGNLDFGLQAVRAIKEELEKKALAEVLEEIENQMKTKETISSVESGQIRDKSKVDAGGWPPKKYRNIRGSGYGTTWTSKSGKMVSKIVNRLGDGSAERNRSKSPDEARQENGYTKEEINTQNYIIRLKNDLVDRVASYEEKIKSLRLNYEDQLVMLRSQIAHLTAELNNKTEQLELRIERGISESDVRPAGYATDEKFDLLQKANKEQETLIKGYQLENERLYTEIKQIKDMHKKDSINLVEQVKSLKCDLIHEKIAKEKNQQQEVKIPSFLSNLNKTILPVNDETQVPVLSSQAEYDLEIKYLNGKLTHLNTENARLSLENKKLTARNESFEKSQRLIEQDMAVIRSKNKEIKKLNDKLKLLENGKLPVDCLRQQKIMKNQLKEMDTLLKKFKNNNIQDVLEIFIKKQNTLVYLIFIDNFKSFSNDPALLKLDFYERKITELKNALTERDSELERCHRAFEQKIRIFNAANNFEGVDIEFRLNEIEVNYVDKLEKMENLVASLRSINREFEQRFDEKQVELEEAKKVNEKEVNFLKAKLEDIIKKNKNDGIKKQVRIKYTPEEFKEAVVEPIVEPCECQVLVKKNMELEEKLKKVGETFEYRLREQTRLYNSEVDKLIKVFMGCDVASGNGEYYSDLASDSPLNDPAQIKLVLASRDRCNQMKRAIEKQKEIIGELRTQCGDIEVYKERSRKMEDVSLGLRKEVKRLQEELLEMKECCLGPELKSYECLKGKIKKIEAGFMKREIELKKLVEKANGGDQVGVDNMSLEIVEIRRFYEDQLREKNKEIVKFKTELDSFLQLLSLLK